jgi:glycerate-2-kinase
MFGSVFSTSLILDIYNKISKISEVLKTDQTYNKISKISEVLKTDQTYNKISKISVYFAID